MARIRTVKPEHWSDKNLPNISLQAHLLWIGLWNFSDDEGVFENDPLLIKSQVFPRRKDVKVDQIIKWLSELLGANFIINFEFEGNFYYKTRTFTKHQKIDKAKPSKIPAEIISKIDDQSSNVRRTVTPVEESRVEESNSSVRERRVNKYSPSPEMELSKLDIGKAIEYLTLTKNVNATREMILSLWTIFKTKNFGGEKFYRDDGDVRSHFFNSLKFENLNGKISKGTITGKPLVTGEVAEGGFGSLHAH